MESFIGLQIPSILIPQMLSLRFLFLVAFSEKASKPAADPLKEKQVLHAVL